MLVRVELSASRHVSQSHVRLTDDAIRSQYITSLPQQYRSAGDGGEGTQHDHKHHTKKKAEVAEGDGSEEDEDATTISDSRHQDSSELEYTVSIGTLGRIAVLDRRARNESMPSSKSDCTTHNLAVVRQRRVAAMELLSGEGVAVPTLTTEATLSSTPIRSFMKYTVLELSTDSNSTVSTTSNPFFFNKYVACSVESLQVVVVPSLVQSLQAVITDVQSVYEQHRHQHQQQSYFSNQFLDLSYEYF